MADVSLRLPLSTGTKRRPTHIGSKSHRMLAWYEPCYMFVVAGGILLDLLRNEDERSLTGTPGTAWLHPTVIREYHMARTYADDKRDVDTGWTLKQGAIGGIIAGLVFAAAEMLGTYFITGNPFIMPLEAIPGVPRGTRLRKSQPAQRSPLAS